jgi:hypothetical protein
MRRLRPRLSRSVFRLSLCAPYFWIFWKFISSTGAKSIFVDWKAHIHWT